MDLNGDSVVGIATGYGLGGSGSNTVSDQKFVSVPKLGVRFYSPPSLLYSGYRVLVLVKAVVARS
jgi:hypothetical protein